MKTNEQIVAAITQASEEVKKLITKFDEAGETDFDGLGVTMYTEKYSVSLKVDVRG